MADNLSDSSSVLQLVRQAVAGNDEAFSQLFGKYRRHLHRFLDLRMDQRLRRRVDPSDILQETQIVAHRRLAEYLDHRRVPIRIWLRRLAHEQWLNERKKHVDAARRSVDREIHLPSRSSRLLSKSLIDGGLSPSEMLSRREQEQTMAIAINCLKEIDREVLLMRTLERLNFLEIAHMLDLSHDAVRKRYGRALIALQRIVERLETGHDE